MFSSAQICGEQCVVKSGGELPSGLDLDVGSPIHTIREDTYRPERCVQASPISALAGFKGHLGGEMVDK